MEKRPKIFTQFNPSEMFDQWIEYTKDEDNFEEHMGFHCHEEETFIESFKSDYSFDNDIPYDEIDENSKEYQIAFEKAKDERIKDLAHDWFYDRLADFTYELEFKTELHEKGIICARVITVPDREEFIFKLINKITEDGYSGVGRFWSWNQDKAEAHWGKSGQVPIKLKAVIPWSAILQKETFFRNMNPTLGEDETEIFIKEDKNLLIIGVDDEDFEEPVIIKS